MANDPIGRAAKHNSTEKDKTDEVRKIAPNLLIVSKMHVTAMAWNETGFATNKPTNKPIHVKLVAS